MAPYLRPTTLADALAALADSKLTSRSGAAGGLTILAGGTDLYPAQAARAAWLDPASRGVLDISAVGELRGIRRSSRGIALGALVTWSEIRAAELPPACAGLQQAAREVGGLQVQNRGTLAGNICNASPAADGVPPLLTLDAEVEIASVRGRRSLPLAAFIAGNRRTVLAPDELVIAVHVPPTPPDARARFLKLGARSYLVISVASVAVVVEPDARGRIARAAIAVGACSAMPVRLRVLEGRVVGMSAGEARQQVATADVHSALSPIDDVRGSAQYRCQAAAILVGRALEACLATRAEAAA